MATPTLWHYTCQHGQTSLTRDPNLRPLAAWNPYAAGRLQRTSHAWMASVMWMTDLETPDAQALGLTSRTIRCDRTLFRWRILNPDAVMHWPTYLRLMRNVIPAQDVASLHHGDGLLPAHWYIATSPVPVEPDPL